VTKPVEIVLVTAPGCHYCDEAGHLLDELAETRPLAVRTVPLSSEVGLGLLVRHRVPFPPILLVDGVFFGYGRISRRKLEEHLARLAKDVAV
jgi:thiol-disulfide isomerase/thioredoxin